MLWKLTFWLLKFFKISSFLFSRRKKINSYRFGTTRGVSKCDFGTPFKHNWKCYCSVIFSTLSVVCGIPDDKLVEAHGSFATAACHLCYTPYPAEEAKVIIFVIYITHKLHTVLAHYIIFLFFFLLASYNERQRTHLYFLCRGSQT